MQEFSDFKCHYVDKKEIWKIAEEFREQYWPEGTLPIDIEKIVEQKLRLNIEPKRGLLSDQDIAVKRPMEAALPVGMPGPDEELVLDQQSRLVSDFQPSVRDRADTEPESVPMHLLRDVDQQFAHPILAPRQAAAFRVLEEPVQRDVGTAQEVDLAIQVRTSRCRIEMELPHSKPCLQRITAGGRL